LRKTLRQDAPKGEIRENGQTPPDYFLQPATVDQHPVPVARARPPGRPQAADARLNRAKSEMLEAQIQTRLSEILRIADEAFDDRDKALSWLGEPNIQIGDERPIEAIGTAAGFRAVKTILRQIQYGVFG
jgi:putative toxin-antitoxin system antitoxin component (TIGR02293 family)